MIYIITGVSKGLGKSLAETFLANGDEVIGVGRSNNISHKRFTFIHCDLSNLSQVHNIALSKFYKKVTLINNAGIIGQIRRLSDQKSLELEDVLQINTIAPMELVLKVYASMNDVNDLTVVNISSGAANRAIPSWAAYCASKAALNMLTETFYLEELEKGNRIKTYSIAPGVVDTDMQKQIRSAESTDFSALDNFKTMKEQGQLFSPKEAAIRLKKLLDIPYLWEKDHANYDLRSIEP